ncbi:hypothetical protein AVEN_161798-1 [Araneus ventricosus]|uniref:Uncharacterized protein n=1 Tax=Araneus ventricosus TaxID=182803 RepID=A0A4Y2NBE7_ARAVE|nr:hypothetical protein AVEN_161798-1 [Araneus ventricosus]
MVCWWQVNQMSHYGLPLIQVQKIILVGEEPLINTVNKVLIEPGILWSQKLRTEMVWLVVAGKPMSLHYGLPLIQVQKIILVGEEPLIYTVNKVLIEPGILWSQN